MNATLRPLPYAYDALEPVLSAENVRLHHDVKQLGYVNGFNLAVQDGHIDNIAFMEAGIKLHEMYWENLAPAGRGGPISPALKETLERVFGSIDKDLVPEMMAAGAKIQGSGWVILACIPSRRLLTVLPIHNHQDGWSPDTIPLLVIDVWEHAYYLDYPANRLRYLQSIWKLVNWAVVSQRFAQVVQ